MDQTESTVKNTYKSKPARLSPALICTIVTLIAIVGAVLGLVTKTPLWIIVFLLPAAIYEAIRTEPGATTKFSSIFMVIILILEIGLIVFNVNYDLVKLFDSNEKYIAGYALPIGDIKVFGPLLLAVLSTVLVFRTYGKYTRWLSIVIAVSSLVAVYLINPTFFEQAVKLIVDGLLNRIG